MKIEVTYTTLTLGGQPIGGGIRSVEWAEDVLTAIREVARQERESRDMPRAKILPDLVWIDGERVPEPSPELRAMWNVAADWRTLHHYTEHEPTGPRLGVGCADCTTMRVETRLTGPECDGPNCDELQHWAGCSLYVQIPGVHGRRNVGAPIRDEHGALTPEYVDDVNDVELSDEDFWRKYGKGND